MPASHSTHGPALREGLDAFFGTDYDEHPQNWERLYKKVTTKKSWYELLDRAGFSTLSQREVGQTTEEETPGLGHLVQIRPVGYGKKFGIFDETKDDDINGIFEDYAKELSKAARETENVLAFLPFVNGFTVNGYDNVPLFSNSHPRTDGGSYDNLVTAADLSLLLVEAYDQVIADISDD